MIDFTSIITDSLNDYWGGIKARELGVFWPSEASTSAPQGLIGKCHRAIFYSFAGTALTNPISGKATRKMLAGKSIEQNEHLFAERAGILAAKNVKTRKNFGDITISAEIDAIYARDGHQVIAEIKSIGGYFAMSEVFGTAKKPGHPKSDNLLQVILYLDIFPQYQSCLLRYIDRTDCETKDFTVTLRKVGGISLATVDGEIQPDFSLERILDRFRLLNSYILANTLPPRDYRPIYSVTDLAEINSKLKGKSKRLCDWRCNYCVFRDRCLKEEKVYGNH